MGGRFLHIACASFLALPFISSTGTTPERPPARGLQLAQAYGVRCATPVGVCFLNYPQPLGSLCFCGPYQGTTIQ